MYDTDVEAHSACVCEDHWFIEWLVDPSSFVDFRI